MAYLEQVNNKIEKIKKYFRICTQLVLLLIQKIFNRSELEM